MGILQQTFDPPKTNSAEGSSTMFAKPGSYIKTFKQQLLAAGWSQNTSILLTWAQVRKELFPEAYWSLNNFPFLYISPQHRKEVQGIYSFHRLQSNLVYKIGIQLLLTIFYQQ